MSYPLVIRLMLAAGLIADIPFVLGWHVPAGKVITEWRDVSCRELDVGQSLCPW